MGRLYAPNTKNIKDGVTRSAKTNSLSGLTNKMTATTAIAAEKLLKDAKESGKYSISDIKAARKTLKDIRAMQNREEVLNRAKKSGKKTVSLAEDPKLGGGKKQVRVKGNKYAKGGAMKKKGYAMGGAMKKKGYAMGGMMEEKKINPSTGMAMKKGGMIDYRKGGMFYGGGMAKARSRGK